MSLTTALQPVMISIESSAIKAVGFDGKDMLVEFHDGKIYEYSDVPANQVCALMFSDSPGRMYQASIHGRYPSRWVNDPRKAQMIGVVEGGAKPLETFNESVERAAVGKMAAESMLAAVKEAKKK